MSSATTAESNLSFKKVLSKVPEVTIYFWIIKVLCTTVGETAADFLNVNLNLGLTGTSIITGILLIIALFFQFRTKKYTPIIYWLTVMFISVFGTLVTDNLTDRLGVPLEVSTIVFSGILAATFLIWYLKEKTLSIHSIFTPRREIFYWLAILFTFALGTASGDLMAEGLGLGYATTGFIIIGLVVLFALGWKWKLNPVLSFWAIYILTRPLGASIGDYLSQPPKYGGLGLGATLTSFIFVGGILIIVTYLSITKADTIEREPKEQIKEEIAEDEHKGGLWQTIVVVSVLVVVSLVGYHMRQSALQVPVSNSSSNNSATSTQQTSPLGDLSSFKALAQNILDAVNKNDFATANSKTNDLEYEWDNAEARLKPRDPAAWTHVDGALDKVFREIRSVHPNVQTSQTALENLLNVLNNP